MIKFNEIKLGDYLMGEYNGQRWAGEVTRLNGDEKQVCLLTDVQEFFFELQDLYPIPINDENLIKLNFSKEEMPDGTVKYKKDAFRLVISKKDDFSSFEMWYREDRRYETSMRYIHQLQNQYLQMTKVHLTKDAVA